MRSHGRFWNGNHEWASFCSAMNNNTPLYRTMTTGRPRSCQRAELPACPRATRPCRSMKWHHIAVANVQMWHWGQNVSRLFVHCANLLLLSFIFLKPLNDHCRAEGCDCERAGQSLQLRVSQTRANTNEEEAPPLWWHILVYFTTNFHYF